MTKFGILGLSEYYGVKSFEKDKILSILSDLETKDGRLYTYKNSYFLLDYFPDSCYVMGTFYIADRDGLNLNDIQDIIGDYLGSKSSLYTSIVRGVIGPEDDSDALLSPQEYDTVDTYKEQTIKYLH